MVLLGYRKDRTNPNLRTSLTLPFILIMFFKMVIFPFPWYFSELELPSWNILKNWKISQKAREYVGNTLKLFYVFYNISTSKCEKWEIHYFKNTAKVLNKSNKMLEPTCGQLFLFRKHSYLELLESSYFYKILETVLLYTIYFSQNYLLKQTKISSS